VSTADPKSSIFYSRSKGLTEEALAELGYKDTIMFRPLALSNTKRPDFRFAESVFVYAMLTPALFCTSCSPSHRCHRHSSLTPVFYLFRAVTGVFSRFSDKLQIDVGVNRPFLSKERDFLKDDPLFLFLFLLGR
jgi:hypothetical protein